MPACPACLSALPPLISGRLAAHNPGYGRVVDIDLPRCPGPDRTEDDTRTVVHVRAVLERVVDLDLHLNLGPPAQHAAVIAANSAFITEETRVELRRLRHLRDGDTVRVIRTEPVRPTEESPHG